MKRKLVKLLVVAIVVCVFNILFHQVFVPGVGAVLGVSQFEQGRSMTETRTFEKMKLFVDLLCFAFVFLCGLLLLKDAIAKFLKGYIMKFTSILLVTASLMFVGCKPYDTPEYKELGNNETGFLIPLEDKTEDQAQFDSEHYLGTKQVAIKRVQIPHRWVQNGRLWFSGEWVATVRLIEVDRTPVTREWTADNGKALAERARTIAHGEADALRLVAEATKAGSDDPTFLAIKRLEVEAARIEAWNGVYPTTMMQLGDGAGGP